LHPQLAEADTSPQQSAFSCGSQQVACSAGEQHGPQRSFGDWAGVVVSILSSIDEADGDRLEWMQKGLLVSADTPKA
jgi:hypothetical protein